MTWASKRELKGNNKLVLLALADYHNGKSGLCCPSTRAIAEWCGLSQPTVNRVIAFLRKEGFIEIKHRFLIGGGLSSNQYSLSFLIGGCYQNDRGVLSKTEGGYYHSDRPVTRKVTRNLTRKINQELNRDGIVAPERGSISFQETGDGATPAEPKCLSREEAYAAWLFDYKNGVPLDQIPDRMEPYSEEKALAAFDARVAPSNGKLPTKETAG